MKITDSLEKVYTAMGGADPFKKDIAEGIEQISEVASGGGGGGGSGLVVTATYTDTTGTLDKTYKQIVDAVEAGTFVTILVPSELTTGVGIVTSFGYQDDYLYHLTTITGTEEVEFIAETEDSYPSVEFEG